MHQAPLALTIGEPSGIGPDITIAAWLKRSAETLPPFYLIGAADLLRRRAALLGASIEIVETSPQDAAGIFPRALPVAPTGHTATDTPGKPDATSAWAAIASIEQAVADVKAGVASAVVTNPIAKSVLYSAGFRHPGHTEFLSELAANGGNALTPVMMIWSEPLAVVPVALHLPLREAI